MTDGTRVVYGDGTSGALIRAAGVRDPTAIAITYEEPERRLRATEILKEAFPDTPIFVRADELSEQKKLISLGATEVIVATGIVASGMGKLLGVQRNAESDTVVAASEVRALGNMAVLYPPVDPYAGERLAGLAEEMDSDKDETRKLYQLFITSSTRNDEGKAMLSELLNELLRTSELFVTDEDVSALLGCDSLSTECMLTADEKYVTFSEFVTLYRKNVTLGKEENIE